MNIGFEKTAGAIPNARYALVVFCAMASVLAACDSRPPRQGSSPHTQDSIPQTQDSWPQTANSSLLSENARTHPPIEETFSFSLPKAEDVDLKTLRFDRLEQILNPIFEALASNDCARQQAALKLIGTPFGAIPKSAEQYGPLASAFLFWIINVSPPSGVDLTPAVKEVWSTRRRRFIEVVERIINLHDPANPEPTRMALSSILPLQSAKIMGANDRAAILNNWRSSKFYRDLTQE